MSEGPALKIADFAVAPPRMTTSAAPLLATPAPHAGKLPGLDSLSGMTLDAIERLVIDNAIEAAGGSLPAAARSLGISPSTLYRKRERWADVAA